MRLKLSGSSGQGFATTKCLPLHSSAPGVDRSRGSRAYLINAFAWSFMNAFAFSVMLNRLLCIF